jgi:hypothetical protein
MVTAPSFVWYNNSDGSSSDYAWLPGHWLSVQEPTGEGSMYYQDSFGVQVIAGDFDPQAPIKRLSEYLGREDSLQPDCESFYMLSLDLPLNMYAQAQPNKPSLTDCLKACDVLKGNLEKNCATKLDECLKKGRPEKECADEHAKCMSEATSIGIGCYARCYEERGMRLPPQLGIPEEINFGIGKTKPWEGVLQGGKRDYDRCYRNRYGGGKLKPPPALPKPPLQ